MQEDGHRSVSLVWWQVPAHGGFDPFLWGGICARVCVCGRSRPCLRQWVTTSVAAGGGSSVRALFSLLYLGSALAVAFATSCTSSPSRGSCAGSCTGASAAKGPVLDHGAPRDPGAAVAAASADDAAEAVSGGRALVKRRTGRSVPAASDAFFLFRAMDILCLLCPSLSAVCIPFMHC